MVRLAATGDLHIRVNDPGPVAAALQTATRGVDALLIAGDITENGRIAEAEQAADILSRIEVPIVAVLGNHDLRSLRRLMFRQVMAEAGVVLLDGTTEVFVGGDNTRVGLAGISGCGGGFWLAEDPDAIHTKAWNTIAIRQRREAAKLDQALGRLEADVRIVLMHFAPTASTLGSEPGMKYWMLGNGELGRVIDQHGIDLVLHGHAHLGSRSGTTLAGTPVRNVAFPVNSRVVQLDVSLTGIRETESGVRMAAGRLT